MCISPQIFNGTEVPCRKCWQCMENRVDGIVGRCIAEQRTSLASYTLTLTYGGDNRLTGEINLRARFLDYRDVTKYLKRLRNYVKVRYVACGEYGDTKGRGHWHLIIFVTKGEVPNLKLDERYMHNAGDGKALWYDGYSFWEEATYQRMRYACAYVLKEVDKHRKNSERRYGSSRFPPLGREYFRQVAFKHVLQGLSPQDRYYSFPEVRMKDGTPKRFCLTRRSAEFYKLDFINAWAQAYGNMDWPQSDMIDEFLDEECKKLSCRPDDWLEQRRFQMKLLLRDHQWHAEGGNRLAVPPGLQADRYMRSIDPQKLDDRLLLMGNRKGIGYVPESISSSQLKSPAAQRLPSRFHPVVETSFGQFGAAAANLTKVRHNVAVSSRQEPKINKSMSSRVQRGDSSTKGA